jgi:Bacterial protein of unknown function (DUF922)
MSARNSLLIAIAWLVLAPGRAPAQRRGPLVPYRPLTWDDFRISDSGDPSVQAHTQGRITYQYRSQVMGRGGSYTAVITALAFDSGFDPAGSWRKSQLASDPAELLKHEQGHLDINEIHAAALRSMKPKQLPIGRGPSPNAAVRDLGDNLQTLFDARIAAAQKEQELYDKETDHGRNSDKQKEWNEKLARRKEQTGIR